MSDLTDRILDLKEKVVEAEKEETQITARLDVAKESLLKEHACKTLKEAEKKIDEFKKDIEDLQNEILDDIEEIEEEI